MQLYTVGLLVVKDKKLLLAFSNNKNCFYLPGGKIDMGETAKQALCREISEELNVQLKEDELQYYTHITAPAYGETAGIIMEQDCFFVSTPVAPHPSSEIGGLKYFNTSTYRAEAKQAPGAVMILEQLRKDGYID
jgi:8-oxo-dGTP pyrophosphatase MutT (NUDIX family)